MSNSDFMQKMAGKMSIANLSPEEMQSRYQTIVKRLQAEKPFETTYANLDMGVCICDSCGNVCSTDYKYCNKCERHIVIFIDQVMRKKERQAEYKLKKQKI